jgi:hypothetical protein
VVDRGGAAVGPWEARFTTGTGPPIDAAPLPIPCAVDEVETDAGCALADDRSIELRLQWNTPVRFFLSGAGRTVAAVAARGDGLLRLAPLPADAEVVATLRVIDLAGVEREEPLFVATTPPLAPLYITEVRADPRGPEPAQEYVELLNAGPLPRSLLGIALSDRADAAGDVIDAPFLIPAGGRVLLVPSGFDPLHPEDDPVPPGALLVRIGSSLASGGLANGGEPLFLRDDAGRRLSAAPATPVPRPGVCVLRVAMDGRTGRPGTFAHDAAAGCTPGLPDRPPP